MDLLLDATGKSTLMETNHQIDDAIDAARDEYPRGFTQEEMNWIYVNDTIKRLLLVVACKHKLSGLQTRRFLAQVNCN
jgi:hypothetical protein